ncbi:MAG: hypothetical protein ACRD5L_14635, partial [Bryobacteraceae bacterium]
AGRKPDCTVSYLEHPSSGRRNPLAVLCEPDYAPYVAWQFGPDSLARFQRGFPFRDPAGLAKFPVDGSQIKESRVVFKVYRPQVHFRRTLVIPEIRLSAWIGANPQ